MTYTENVTAMAADWMAGVLSGDGPDALSPMVVTALPDPALPETGRRVIAAEAGGGVRPRAGRARPRPAQPVFCCAQRDRAAIEFAETSPDGTRCSSIVTMQLAAGSITRIVAFRHAYVPRLAGPGAAGTSADAAQLLVRRYLDDLEAGRATEAAACFADDAIYSFPPRTADGDLSMDYQVFLMSRIKERYDQGGSTRDAVTGGVASTARIITGAALIIVVVFAGFARGQLVMFQQMGFGVAVALLLDATIVRTVILPSTLTLLDHRSWYLPRWLDWLPGSRSTAAPERWPFPARPVRGGLLRRELFP